MHYNTGEVKKMRKQYTTEEKQNLVAMFKSGTQTIISRKSGRKNLKIANLQDCTIIDNSTKIIYFLLLYQNSILMVHMKYYILT